jgi:LuxR family maltose regulon positive regulatory protein
VPQSLLTTKFFVPFSSQSLVSRKRLIEQLDQGLQRRLSLVSAPAGFGKTTLVAQWGKQTDRSLAWLSLDANDSDLVRFLSYLIVGLTRAVDLPATTGENALHMLQASQSPSAEAVLTMLINDLSTLENEVLFVLDDYHLVENDDVHQALAFLIEYLPPHIHLVITTRIDPPLPLARMRGRNQLMELRAADLRFTQDESADFLNQVMGLQLSGEDIAALEDRTEGWIAGLQLAAISMQGLDDTASFIRSFTGSHRYILDYLIEEVLHQQSEEIQIFMLQTAVLDRLNGGLCDAVMEKEGGQNILERLEQANLFVVPLDNERRWYRYHHLFADLLRQRLHLDQPEQVKVFQVRASEWHARNGLFDAAVEYAIRAEDYERALGLIEEIAEDVWLRGVDTQLRHWLDAMPEGMVCTRPQLCIFHGWYMLSAGRQDAAEKALDAAEMALDALDGPIVVSKQLTLTQSNLRGRIATTRAFLASYRGETEKIIRYASKALEYLPDGNSSWRGTAVNVLSDGYDFSGEMGKAYQCRLDAVESCRAIGIGFITRIANLKLAITQRVRGQLQHVKDICRQELQLARESGMAQTVVSGWLRTIYGEVLAELNELEEARSYVEKGIAIVEQGSELSIRASSYIFSLRVYFSTGEYDKAEEIIQELERAICSYDVPPWIDHHKEAWKARIWLARGEMGPVTRWCEERGLVVSGDLVYSRELEYMVFARSLIASGQEDEGIDLLQRMHASAIAGDRISRAVEMLILQAEAQQAKEKMQLAGDAIEAAISLAEPGKFVRVFVDEGAPIEALLRRIKLKEPNLEEYVQTLLSAFSAKTAIGSQAGSQGLIEPLSDREIEVLQHIAEGLTNQEIASHLYLSLNTIKVHTRNIYSKLGVKSRTQAVARAQELGIISS